MTKARLLCSAFLATLFLLPGPHARADSRPRIVVVDAAGEMSSAPDSSAFRQMAAELASDGYEVVIVSESEEGQESLEVVAEEADAVAVIRTRRTARGLGAQVWTRKNAAITEARAEGHDAEAARLLALRTVELLRGQRLAQDPEAEAETETEAEAERESSHLSIALGLSYLSHTEGIPGAFAPSLIFGYRLGAFQVELRGLSAAESRLATAEGAATFDQALATAAVRVDPLAGETFSPFVTLVAGAYALAGEGSAQAGLVASSVLRWTSATGLGAGASYTIHSADVLQVGLTGRAEVLWLSPQPVVRFVEREIARAGQPLFIVSGGVDVVF